MLLDPNGDLGTAPLERGLGDWRIALRRDDGADDVVQGPFDNGGHPVAVEGGVRVDVFAEDESRGGAVDGKREGVWDDVVRAAGRSRNFSIPSAEEVGVWREERKGERELEAEEGEVYSNVEFGVAHMVILCGLTIDRAARGTETWRR